MSLAQNGTYTYSHYIAEQSGTLFSLKKINNTSTKNVENNEAPLKLMN